MSAQYMRERLQQGAVILKTNTGAGIMIDLGVYATVEVSPRYESEGQRWSAIPTHWDFAGFDIRAETAHDGRMLYVANFDDLFGRVRAEAAEQPGLPPARPELPR